MEKEEEHILNLFPEIFSLVLSHCDYLDYGNLYRTCHKFKHLISNEVLWELILRERYPYSYNIINPIEIDKEYKIYQFKWFLSEMLKDTYNTYYYKEGMIEDNIVVEAMFNSSTVLLKLLTNDKEYLNNNKPSYFYMKIIYNIIESHDFENRSLEFKEEYFIILLDCPKILKHIDIRFLCKRMIYKSLYKLVHFIINKYNVNIKDDELIVHFCLIILFSEERGFILDRSEKQLALEHVVRNNIKDNMYVMNSFTEEDIKYIMENFQYDRNNDDICTNNVVNILYTKFHILKDLKDSCLHYFKNIFDETSQIKFSHDFKCMVNFKSYKLIFKVNNLEQHVNLYNVDQFINSIKQKSHEFNNSDFITSIYYIDLVKTGMYEFNIQLEICVQF